MNWECFIAATRRKVAGHKKNQRDTDRLHEHDPQRFGCDAVLAAAIAVVGGGAALVGGRVCARPCSAFRDGVSKTAPCQRPTVQPIRRTIPIHSTLVTVLQVGGLHSLLATTPRQTPGGTSIRIAGIILGLGLAAHCAHIIVACAATVHAGPLRQELFSRSIALVVVVLGSY